MGAFRITINAVGGHGVDRSKGNNELVDFLADGDRSPDAIISKAVEELKATGCSITEATIHHWPGTGNDVVDNFLSKKRRGSF